MSVRTIFNGWSVLLEDEKYIEYIRGGLLKKPDFVFLFDTTGYAAEPFTKAGYTTLIVDMANVGQYTVNPRASAVADWNVLDLEDFIAELCSEAKLIVGFPPCTELAGSGAKHWYEKSLKDGNFQIDAVYLARSVERIGKKAKVTWIAENPKGKLSVMWRSPNHFFNPYEYGGYLPADDVHPNYPKYIAPRDAYPKETFLWSSDDFKMPPKLRVVPEPGYSRQFRLLGGSSAKTKRIRSASPRGFFLALAKQYA